MIDMVALVATVQAYFDAFELGTAVSLGWAEQGKQTNQGSGGANRVVFVPLGGDLEGTQYPGGEPRSLYDDSAKFEVRVWAVDRTTPERREDHAYQANATKALFAWVVRALCGFNRPPGEDPDTFVSTYAGAVVWGPYGFTPAPGENAFGRELRATLTFLSTIADVPHGTFSADFTLNKSFSPPTTEP